MTTDKLENDLWEAADNLRANSKLTAAQYSMPILGLIFLRHAYNRFLTVKTEIEPSLPKRKGKTRELVPSDFIGKAAIYLPPEAYYDHIVELPEGVGKANAIIKAMEKIENQNPNLKGALPKEYLQFEPKLLSDLVKIFNRDSLRNASGDVFGKIYEYFLNKFAQTGAQEGGEFFTPPSLVKMIVNVIEPDHGVVLDPACGSAGMMVQTGHFIENLNEKPHERVIFHGQEKAEVNSHLARMNLAVHGLEGNIRIANTFYDELPELINGCDFVMANPPFNVDGVDTDKVKKQIGEWDDEKANNKPEPGKRLPFGLPGTNAKTKAISNANSLWIEYFYAYLNNTGRAGFVMASSAPDAGGKDKEIRRRLVSTGHVDVMMSIGNKFFYTRALPCTLWFFDKGKPNVKQAAKVGALNTSDHVLMINARDTYHVESARHHCFTDEQLLNLTAIVWLHRGEAGKFHKLIASYHQTTYKHIALIENVLAAQTEIVNEVLNILTNFAVKATLKELNVKKKNSTEGDDAIEAITAEQLAEFKTIVDEATTRQQEAEVTYSELVKAITKERKAANKSQDALALKTQLATQARLEDLTLELKTTLKIVEEVHKTLLKLANQAEKALRASKSEAWDGKRMRKLKYKLKPMNEKRNDEPTIRDITVQMFKDALHFVAQGHWLLHRFPEGKFVDVPGLCKRAALEEIEAKDWSLTPGRFVGVAPDEVEDEEDFIEIIQGMKLELRDLNKESLRLTAYIDANLKELII